MATRTPQPGAAGKEPAKRQPAARKPAAKTTARKPRAPRPAPADRPAPKMSKAELLIKRREMAKQALQLRTLRMSYDAIAKQVGYSSRSAAYTAVKRELALIPREAAKELRISELETLDVAQRALVNRIASGDLGAIDRMIKIMDMRAKLTGLYEEPADTGIEEVTKVLAAFMGQAIKLDAADRDDELNDLDDDEIDA